MTRSRMELVRSVTDAFSEVEFEAFRDTLVEARSLEDAAASMGFGRLMMDVIDLEVEIHIYDVPVAFSAKARVRTMRFEKWQALGNDYVIVERDELPWELDAERVRVICEPHFGIGSDGVLLLARPDGGDHVADLRIFNPDGSEAELSGNGAREAALYLRRAGWTDADEFSILTGAGEIRPRILSPTSCSIDMGRASTASEDFPSGAPDGVGTLEAGGREWSFQHVSIGNPQCVIEVGEEVEWIDLGAVGPDVESSALFPNRTNVSFIRVDGNTVRARIFERGVGETLSSGTGASGAAVAAVLSGAESPITVRLDGGELEVEVTDELDVVLTGTAEPVFAGELSTELLHALARA